MYTDSAVSVMSRTLAPGYRLCNSTARIVGRSRLLSDSRVKTIDDIRLSNLLQLIKHVGGQRHLADRIGKAPAQISQWVNRAPNSNTGAPRRMSTETAREMELLLGLPLGWMDAQNDHVPLADSRAHEVREAQTEYRALRPDQLAILDLWEALDPSGRRTVQEVGHAFAKSVRMTRDNKAS